MNNIKIERVWAMPNKRTFQIPPIKKLIKDEIPDNYEVIDPFPFEYFEDATDYLKRVPSFHYGLFDPPYSPRQLKECYKGKGEYDTKASTWSNWKDLMAEKVTKKCISFGWNTCGLGKKR
ncbi:MAG: site-specific DNA-methyltransferase, partial [Thermodesulfobacteriota bacterium]